MLLADGIPILMRLINHKDFEPGPFNLGKFGPLIGTIACLWVAFLTVSVSDHASCNVCQVILKSVITATSCR